MSNEAASALCDIAKYREDNDANSYSLAARNKRKRTSSISEDITEVRDVVRQSHQAKESNQIDRSISQEENPLTEKVCLCQPDPKIPRPRNAFILFRQHHQSNLTARHPGLSNPEISKLLGEEWRNSPTEIKNKWKQHAEAEKERHTQKHPGYKYQPRRYSQRRIGLESGGETGTVNCEKCGGLTTHSSGHPMSAAAETIGVPSMPNALTKSTQTYQIQPYSNNRIISSLNRQNSSSRPPNIAIPSSNPIQSGHEDRPSGPKRRRLTNRQTPTSYLIPTPYKKSFAGRFGPDQARQWGPLSADVDNPSSNIRPNAGSPDLALTSSITATESPNLEQCIASIPFLLKVYQLGRIAPPYKAISSDAQGTTSRGVIIAVEGDDQLVVEQTVHWLERYLTRLGEYFVKSAQGPIGPRADEEASIADYLKVIADWQIKSSDLIAFITGKIVESGLLYDEEIAPDAPNPTSLMPIIVLQRFQLFAANAYATHIPIRDAYKPMEHWQWMASLWRGTIGPDVTICIKDVRSEDLRKDTRLVEVQDELGVIIVKREVRAGRDVPSQANLGESTMRRLGFEISELVRNIGTSPRD